VIATIVGGWVIVPWKISSSAETFLAFMGGYAVFLAPIAGILASDYWLVKKQHIDVPALYNPNGRYRYWNGINWRALLSLIVSVAPNLPGLGYSIDLVTLANGTTTDNVKISAGANHLYTFDWMFRFVMSIFCYTVLSYLFPAKESQVAHTIYGHEIMDEGSQPSDTESNSARTREKKYGDVDEKRVMAEL
jgi:NCS1 family nucleobase:cation symporter-1